MQTVYSRYEILPAAREQLTFHPFLKFPSHYCEHRYEHSFTSPYATVLANQPYLDSHCLLDIRAESL
jgi:hypothetical protein